MVYSCAHKILILVCQSHSSFVFASDKNKTCKHILWDENNERVGNQYAARLSSQCGGVRWVVLLPLSGCLGVNGRLTMKDIVSPHIWEQMASQGDFTA